VDARWATCPLTQLGFVRIVSNPAFSRDALSPVAAAVLLAENLAHPAHEFWIESLQVPTAIKGMESGLQGDRQLTDAYLLGLSSHRKSVLATFDRGLRTLAGRTFGVRRRNCPNAINTTRCFSISIPRAMSPEWTIGQPFKVPCEVLE
jgi:predicted nucleic acid-binding protein